MLKKIVKVIANVSFLKLAVVLGVVALILVQYYSFRVDFLRLRVEAQEMQIKKLDLLLRIDCFNEEKVEKCKTLFDQFSIVLPKK